MTNDPHQPNSIPAAWHISTYSYPNPDGSQYEVSGCTVVGSPLIIMGSNGHLSWSGTILVSDINDIYEETIKDDKYKVNDEW